MAERRRAFDKGNVARVFLISLCAWTGLAILQGLESYSSAQLFGFNSTLAESFRSPLINYPIYALLSPFIIYLVEVRPWRGWLDTRSLALFPLVFASFLSAHSLLRMFTFELRNPRSGAVVEPSFRVFMNLSKSNFFRDLSVVIGLIVLGHFLKHRRRAREMEAEAGALATKILESELLALRSQLEPHFLFNALHTIATLVELDPAAAREATVELAQFLRLAIAHRHDHQVKLCDELRLLESYLYIQKIRYKDRLQVEVDVADDVRSALVPSLLLQPLVENAIRHGIDMQPGTGRVCIRARRTGDSLAVVVNDNGPGLPQDFKERDFGLGLSNVSARLVRLYDGKGQINLASDSDGGTRVEVCVPFSLAGSLTQG